VSSLWFKFKEYNFESPEKAPPVTELILFWFKLSSVKALRLLKARSSKKRHLVVAQIESSQRLELLASQVFNQLNLIVIKP